MAPVSRKAFKEEVIRNAQGDKAFRTLLMKRARITLPEAVAVQARYFQNAFVQRDRESGHVAVIHTGLLERRTILRSLAKTKA